MLPRLRILALSALAASGVLQSNSSAQTTIWSDDFESGFSQWSVTGLWHWIRETNDCAGPALPFPSATYCMWYGIDGQCNFDNGNTNSGFLQLLNPVALPNSGQGLALRYRDWRSAEQCGCGIGNIYDETRVDVSINFGQWTSLVHDCDPQFPWRKGRADLTPYAGMNARVRFSFNSVDGSNNGTLGWLIDDVSIQLEAGRSYCETSGCPCTTVCCGCPHYNVGGCKNSTSTTAGAELFGSGTPSVATDDVVLTIEGMPATSFVTFLQGDVLSNAIVFGDGLRCIGGALLRLGTKAAVNGVASYPEPPNELLSVKGMIPPAGGVTVGYQGHYRDNGSYCTSANFNLSNAYQVAWIP